MHYLIFFISTIFISITTYKSKNIYKINIKALKSSFLLHPNNSVLMLILILITTNSIELDDKTYVYDSMHPSYEYTLGNSFSNSFTYSSSRYFLSINGFFTINFCGKKYAKYITK